MKHKKHFAKAILNFLKDYIFTSNIIFQVKFLGFKSAPLLSRKLLAFLFILPFGLSGYSQSYEIDDVNGTTVTTCSGFFYDSNYSAGLYNDNENYTVTFCSSNGNALKFSFSSFWLENLDTLYVYDGPNTSSPLFRKYTGSRTPFSINSTGTCFTFVFKSNSIFTRLGWAAAISCCPPPVTSPIVPSVDKLCAGSIVNYSVDNHAGSTYNWTVLNGTPASVTGGVNNLNVTWDINGNVTGIVKVVEVNNCGSKDSSELVVDIDRLPTVNFSGLNAYYCIYSAPGTLTGFPAGGSFSGPGITGNTFNPATAGAGTHSIVYFYTDPITNCSNQRTILTTVDVPSLFTVGASATSYCTGSGVSITLSGSQAGVNYQLRVGGVDDGAALPGTGSPLTWTNKTLGVYTVVATSSVSLCNNNMSGSQTITENPLPVPAFSSQPGIAACSADNVTYITQPGQSNYIWGFTGISGTDYIISSGGGTTDNNVTLRWLTSGSKTVTINYTNSNGCTATAPTSSIATIITINPPAPTGAAIQNFCSETSPTIADLSAAGSGIQWYTASSGGSLLLVSTPLTDATHYFASQTVGGCESTTRLDVTASISSIPLPPVANAGSGAACSQIITNWTTSARATSYRLDVSTVNTFSSYVSGYQDLDVGNVTTYNVPGLTAGTTYYYRIRAVNYCGTSGNSATIIYATLPATPAIPGPITGTTPQCPGLLGQIYSVGPVPNATIYTWTVPVGWTITSGQGTISITVSTGVAGQNGNIGVTAGNICGTSAPGILAVTINPNAAITSVTGLSPLCIGGTSVYTANGVVLGGGVGAWSSSNPAVATVSPAGLVTGISIGTSNIIYTITGGCGGTVSAQQSVTISPNAAITSVTGLSPLCIGGTTAYTANGAVLSGGTGAWSSSNPAIATVSPAGLVTGISAGTCDIIYTITGGCGGTVSAQQSVTITPNAAIASVTGLSPLCIGATAVYTANGVVLSGGTGAWSSSNPAVATVSVAGLVTGISAGTCNIIYTITGGCGGTVSAQQSVTINPNTAITSVTGLSPLCIGGTSVYTANGVVLGGGTGAWSSSNPAVATVSVAGLVTGISTGTCNIIYTITGGCGGTVSAQQPVTINQNPVITSVTGLSPLCIGGTSVYNANGVILGGGTGAWSSSDIAIASVDATGLVTGISAGTCNIIYTITGGCGGTVSAQQSVTINPNAAITSVTGLSPLCIGGTSVYTANGVVLGGGVGAWSSSNPAVATVSPAGLVTGISIGTSNIIYTITGGCGGTVSAQQSVTISPNAAITSVTGLSPLCIGGTTVYTANGVVLSGGTGAWSSSNPAIATVSPAGLVTGISAGTCDIIYTITGGCGGTVSAQQSVTITPNAAIASVTGLSPLCIGATAVYTANGVVLSGGTGAWSSSNPAVATVDATGLVTGISAGTCNIIYTITGGCSGTVSTQQPLTISPDVSITSVTGSSPMCIGGSTIFTANGVVLSGGTGVWSSSNPVVATVDATGLVTGLSLGSSDIIYTISGGCGAIASAFRNITITTVPVASISYTGTPWCSNTGIQNVTLIGTSGGTFSAAPAGLSIDTVTGTIDPGTSIGGTYTVSYTISAVGCGIVTATTSVTVNQAPSVLVTNPVPVCAPATVDLTASSVTAGSTPGLTFTYWTDAAATIVLITPNSVTSGVYYIKGTDLFGCSDIIKPVTVTVNPLPAITGTQTNVLCNGANTGAIDITVTGGTGPYIYTWTGTGVTVSAEDQSNIVAGLYSVVVTDANFCNSATFQVTITEPPALSGTISSQTNVSVFGGNDGSVTVNGAGGTSPYLYKIGSGTYQVSGTFGTLTAGSYTVTVQDINLCTFNVPVIITQPLPPLSGSIVSQINVLCFGASTGSVTVQGSGGLAPYNYRLNGGIYQLSGTFTALASGVHTITVRDATLNTFDVSVTITQPSAILGGIITSQTNILCFGNNTGSVTVSGTGGIAPYQYKMSAGSYQASGTFSSLTAGVYTVTVQDANLCTFNVTVTITQPTARLTGSILSQQNVTCSGSVNGSVTVAGAGGTSPYLYSLNGAAFLVSGSYNGLARGNYSIAIRDANLCSVTVPVAISEPAVLSIASDKTDASCPGVNDGSITLTITGGTQPYTVIWSDGVTTAMRSNIPDGTYSAVVTDIKGCAASIDVVVGVVGTDRCLEVQGIITPNNDGYNDTWKIKNIDLFPDAEVFVFNRWGQLVFNTKNISDNPWDGTLNGKLLPTDSYHYTLHLNDGSKQRSGVISIIR